MRRHLIGNLSPLVVAAVLLFLPALVPAAEDLEKIQSGEKLLFGFESELIPADALLWKGLKEKISDGQATEGKKSLCVSIRDEYGFLGAKSSGNFYERWRYGGILRTLGWFDKVFPEDWSGWPLLRFDFRTDCPGIRPRVEIEDVFLPFPVTVEFEIPGNTWVTLEVDLEAAVRERRLDPAHIAHLLIMIWSVPENKRDFKCYVDKIRLARRDSPVSLPLVRGEAFLEPYSFKMTRECELPPYDISKTALPDGETHTALEPSRGGGGYPLIYVNERCVGGFGDGGIILAPDRFARLSLDSGNTWSGLDGKPPPTVMSDDHRGQHRSQTMIEGNNIYMAYCTADCAGGGTRVTSKFTRAIYRDGRWITGPESIIDQTSRYCHDRFALCRDKGGRLWCAWSHLNNKHSKDIRAKWSMDSGATWLEAGENAIIGARGVFHYPGTPGNYEGPYLTGFENAVAAFWHREPDGDIVWTRSVPIQTKIEKIADGKFLIPLGASHGLKRNCNIVLGKEGKMLTTLLVDSVDDCSSSASAISVTGNDVKTGDEATAMTWTKEEVILRGSGNGASNSPRPHSAATSSAGTLYLGITGSKVLCRDSETDRWMDDSPPGLKGNPLLSSCGDNMICLWIEGEDIMMSVKARDANWGSAKVIVHETEPVEDLAAPQNAPEKFIPVAWSTKSRKKIKTMAVPIGQSL